MPPLDLLAPAYVTDPYPIFGLLRQHDPMHRSRTGAWVLTRYRDVAAALADPRLSNAPSRYAVVNERHRHRYVCADVANNILPFLDAPAHTCPRRLINKTFRKRLRQFHPEIAAIAERRWRRLMTDQAEFDVLSDFATPYAVEVIAALIGVPEGERGRLKDYTEYFFYLFTMIPSESVREKLDETLGDFRDYFRYLLQVRREQPASDFVSALLQANSRELENPLSEAELIDNLLLLFADGVENVDSAITTAVALLLRDEAQLYRLAKEPELVSLAVEECLRFESPAQFIGRIALEDIELHGVRIRAHDVLLLMLASANRDPGIFDRPERFIIDRKPNPYLSFGKARHSCIGGSLVRQELIAALRFIFRTSGLMPLETELRWQPRLGHRWLEGFWVEQQVGRRDIAGRSRDM